MPITDGQLQQLRAQAAADVNSADAVEALAVEVISLRAENVELRARLAAQQPTPTPVPTPEPPTSVPPQPVPAGQVMFGAYVDDLPSGRTKLPALERRLDTKLELVSAFTDWSYLFGNDDDEWMSNGGTRPVLYSWEPFGIRFADVTSGRQDAYLQRVADSMLTYPHDIYVRPWGEMNANWSTWQPTSDGSKANGGTPTEFVAAWRYLIDFFRSRNVGNLKFVFAPDASDYGNNTRIADIWPGATDVDVLGIDGYNWGKDGDGGTWRYFENIFADMYDRLTALHATAPVWITEVGCKEPSASDGAPVDAAHTKAQWLSNMMAALPRFPRLEAIAYFNVKKERDWRIESSADAVTTLKGLLAARRT